MSLLPGTRLDRYEIVSLLGSGGMGEVYRAHDTTLNRDVAIKILPDMFALDAERLARFTREAQTLASLNHPNIAQIHGFEQSASTVSGHGGLRALVMELVEGDDLTTRTARGAIPIDEAVAIARQIAAALEAAHEQGVVHRDLKPANVKVRPDGTVKVLDFGLAKAMDPTTSPPNVANSPTFTAHATRIGVILGTAAYMSPEQAAGRVVDKRTDIWSFGALLFEMVAGRPLFEGETASELIAAVLRQDIDLRALPSDTPPAIRRLIERCLERDAKLRLRDIGEARIALTAPSPAVSENPPASRRGLLRALACVLGGGIAGGAIMWMFTAGRTSVSGDEPAEFTLRRLTQLPGPELQPDISPDGRQVVFASAASGNLDVYLLRSGGGRAINLTPDSPGSDEQATYSPDGERIAFRSERDGGGLFIMGATGESVRRVTNAGFDPAWSPDGRSLAYSTESVLDPYGRNVRSELWVANVESGKTVRIFEGDAVQPAWSPDGTRIAYWANNGGQRDIWTIPSSGGTPVAITHDAATDWSPEWSPEGRWLYFSSDRGGMMNLWRLPMDQKTGAVRGAPEPVTHSFAAVGFARFAGNGGRMSVSAYSRSFDLSVAPFDGNSARVGPLSTVRNASMGWCSLSPEGRWLACTTRGAQEDIVLMRSDGSETIRLTDDPAKDRNPMWSRDGSTIAFMSTRGGVWELWSVRRDGSNLRQMTDLKHEIFIALWGPDGQQVMTSASVSPPFGTWLFETASMATRSNARFFPTPIAEPFAVEAWSPDGARVAGSILNQAGNPIAPAVRAFPDGPVRRIDLRAPATVRDYLVAGWLPDSRRFVVPTERGLALVDAATGMWTDVAGAPRTSRVNLSADGRTVYFESVTLDADVWLLEMK